MSNTLPRQFSGQRMLFFLAVAAGITAAASLLWVGEATSRDTNNWLIWARQLSLGNQLDFTGGVPSWKPFPVVVSLPFARISPALSNLFWLWLVRFSWLMCSVLLGTLALRSFGKLAAVIAGTLPLALPAWFAYALMGDSEPVATALALGAALIAQARRFRLAIGFLIAAGLLRPELWPLLLILIGWRWRSDRRSAYTALLCAAAALFIGWSLLPALAGGGWGQAASRASTRLLVGNSAEGYFTLLPLRAWLLVAIGGFGVWQRRDRMLALVAAVSLGLAAEVEVMSWFGFSGLDRYVMPGIIGLCAIGGAGAGTLLGLARLKWAKLLVGGLITALVGGLIWSATPLDRDNVQRRRSEGQSATRAVAAFDRAGGVARFEGCLPLATNGSWSVILGRMLGLPLRDVTNFKTAPAVVLRPTNLKSYKNGPAINPMGIKPEVIGFEPPDWAVVLYPGCEANELG